MRRLSSSCYSVGRRVFGGGEMIALEWRDVDLGKRQICVQRSDWNGQVTSPTFTAHPKIDPETGNLCAFGYAAKGLLTRDMVYYELTAAGEKKREVWFEIPYYCMMHDFGVTRDYAVFHVVPIVSSWERLKAGLPHFGFDTSLPIYLGVLPRHGDASAMRWFKAPTVFASQTSAFSGEPTRPRVAKNIRLMREEKAPQFLSCPTAELVSRTNGDRSNTREVDDPRIRAGSHDDHLWAMLAGEAAHFVVVDSLVLFSDTVGDDREVFS